ncbi:putative nucleoredoxin 2 [Dorcoceras hygrometricum]|uniref:protein-disulfide reductase n=1 Tax=Dorcoceras hygrometricum TaxID=472368 RepID=A0A2Z7BFH0_9LAMI|nr:putative nucleoredoxin 2 [Dorcoceras hygrometricum]
MGEELSRINGDYMGNGNPGMGYGSVLGSLLGSKDGDFLLSPTTDQVKISYLEGKVIGIYFSANWYPPCRKFTTTLANTYEQLKKSNVDPGFEVVFVSSDEELDSFNEYRSSMPWLSIPFSATTTKRALNMRFDVESIPCLIILQPNYDDKQDSRIENGVDIINRFGARAHPFTKERLAELMEEEKERRENQTLKELLTTPERDFLVSHSVPKKVPIASLMGETIGLYFSAQWCSPGVKFTPKLASIYHKIKQQSTTSGDNDSFEIVFVSSDKDESSFDSHFHTMPWLALPFSDPTTRNLIKYFDIQSIPSLVILSPDGKTVTKQGRNLINLYEENAYPFTQVRIRSLELKNDEDAESLPKSRHHSRHGHEVTLVSDGNGGGPFICCDCDEQGFGWAYQCIECGYEVHPKCVRDVEHA